MAAAARQAVAELEETLGDLYTAYNSKTWRVGKTILRPFARLREQASMTPPILRHHACLRAPL